MRNIIVLIRKNNEIQQNWIPKWEPEQAITIILSLPNPHQYFELILQALNKIPFLEKEDLKKHLQKAYWLPLNNQGVRPIDILKLPKNLICHQDKIASLENNKYSEDCLALSLRKSENFKEISKLFTYWNEGEVIQKIFGFQFKPLDFWNEYYEVVLSAIKDFKEINDISNNLKNVLETESWIVVGERTIRPSQILEIVPAKLRRYISELVDLTHGAYVEVSALPEAVKTHESFKLLRNFFTKWRENDVIDLILNGREPHQLCEIIIEAVNCLLDSKSGFSLSDSNFRKMKTKAWLVDREKSAVFPEMVIHYPAIEQDVEVLLRGYSHDYITSSQLAVTIRNRQECWSWLTENLFSTHDKALEKLGGILRDTPEYQLGKFDEFPLEKCWDVFQTVDVSFLPAWGLAEKLPRKKFADLLLPNLLGRIPEDKLTCLLQNLSGGASPPLETTVEVFNDYLAMAVEYGILDRVLPQVYLLNRRGEWQTPELLTWGRLDNIDGKYVLDENQELIMYPYLENLSATEQDSEPIHEPAVDESNFEVLRNYFKDWDRYCAPEPVGAFLSWLYGKDGKVEKLASCYLGKRNPDFFRQTLADSQPIISVSFRIHVGHPSDRTREVLSVLGELFKAELANLKNPKNLFVNELMRDGRELELLPITPQNFSPTELAELLKNSTRVLLTEVYRIKPVSLDEFWENLLRSGQLDIQVAKTYLLEGAPYVLSMVLGAHKENYALKKLFDDWDKLRHQKGELELHHQSVEKLDKQIKDIISKLSNLLEDRNPQSDEVRASLLNCVRSKIQQHGYHPQSILFELFQNADDAVVEWGRMSPDGQVEDKRKQIAVVWSDHKLLFIHAGRPIGCFQHPGNPQKHYRSRGYDRDLVKMLSLNASDKENGVTGKFGLGFKSVYLACGQPYVLSKSLGFTVEGGLIPSRLVPEKINELREEARSYDMDLDPTVIELNLDQGVSAEELIKEFQNLASILMVFSRAIKTCCFVGHGASKTITWNSAPLLAIEGVEAGKFDWEGERATLLCLRMGEKAESALLIGFAERSEKLTPIIDEHIPTFWVMAPTQEKLGLGFVLNAGLDITTGRESLVKSSVRNRELASAIGAELGKVLYRLFRKTEENWETVAETLSITSADEYDFWDFLWQELAIRWQRRDPSERREILALILGGDHGIGYLILHHRALPSGLYGPYRQLLSMREIRYQVTGKLSERECFLKVARWPGFQQAYQGKLVNQTQWEDAKKLLGSSFVAERYPIKPLRLLDVLKLEIGTDRLSVNSLQAQQMGALFTKDFLADFGLSSSEANEIRNFLQELKFMSVARSYRPSSQLLNDRNSNSDEERLLARFAPDDRVVNFDYKDSALDFFAVCRMRREVISIEELIKWALQAETNEKRQAVRQYLLCGERKEEFGSKLYQVRANSWIVNDSGILEILKRLVWLEIEKGNGLIENEPVTDKEDFPDYQELNFEFPTTCTQDDFSLSRSADEIKAFSEILLDGLSRQDSYWKGYIYHFTHIENAVSIIRDQSLRARNFCSGFGDSAGPSLIGRTRNQVKNFARFYFRPLTPTQWHNESLGKRCREIYAICPVPIFFRFDLKKVLQSHRGECAVSNGNLAASYAHYGNSTYFLKQYFDFENVYSTLSAVGKNIYLRASQQEFIINHSLELVKLDIEDVHIICRTEQDKNTLLHMIGRNSKYASRVFVEEEIGYYGSFFYHHNPHVKINDYKDHIELLIDNYSKQASKIDGKLLLRFSQESPLDYQITSDSNDISKIALGSSIEVNATRNIQLRSKPNTGISVYFQEHGKDWLIYTDES
ncbi:MAG: hypothetical protein N5P05_002732 [Chroococcopsis gigantea SAG 12.99]|nr:hypothetical protein [Chroococcopsis gigantea SAG 12.99]